MRGPIRIADLPTENSPSPNDYLVIDGASGTRKATIGSVVSLGGGGAPSDFWHHQNTPSSTWTINHGLNRYPNVAVYTEGLVQIWAEVQHTSPNQTVIRLSMPIKGFARLV